MSLRADIIFVLHAMISSVCCVLVESPVCVCVLRVLLLGLPPIGAAAAAAADARRVIVAPMTAAAAAAANDGWTQRGELAAVAANGQLVH